MKLRVLWTGKTRNAHLAAVASDYIDRIGHFVGLEVVELKEPKTREDRKRIADEGDRILARLERSDYVIALDERGKPHTSQEFARLIGDRLQDSQRDVAFVVGGPAGLSDPLKARADLELALSAFTFSHDLARTVLLEQVYRALSILRNLPYAR